MEHFVKESPAAPSRSYEAEAAGLAWLAEAGGAPVVRVVEADARRIVLERLEPSSATRRDAADFGAALAATHAAGAPAFGAPPPGWSGPSYIGKRPMWTGRAERWGEFYAEHRVLPYVRVAREAGSVTSDEWREIEAACAAIASGCFDDDEPPARLHGDLWAGNVVWTRAGAVLIDPAAHGGHRETDLAMLALFGAPHLEVILEAYDAASPLRPGWRERVPLHQLHPLAVHAASYGRGYGAELVAAARAVLQLA